MSTNLPATLRAECEAAAEKASSDCTLTSTSPVAFEGFLRGCEYLYARLSGAAPAFDESLALKIFAHRQMLDSVEVARWQHEQDAAAMGAMREEIARLKDELKCVEFNLEQKSKEIGRAEHRGNTVDYIYDKCENYGRQLGSLARECAVLREALELADNYLQGGKEWTFSEYEYVRGRVHYSLTAANAERDNREGKT
jgi:hypothetical protein